MTKLWSVDDIAEFSSYSRKTAWKIVSQPGFPEPIRVFNGAHPRWKAEEVIAWIDARQKAA